MNFISYPLFEHLRKRGILVFYWVLNDPEDYRRAAEVFISPPPTPPHPIFFEDY